MYKLANNHCSKMALQYPKEFKECLEYALNEIKEKAEVENNEVVKGRLDSSEVLQT